MGTGKVKIVIGPIKVVGHGGKVAGAVLLVVGAALGNSGYLGNGVGVVGRLQRTGQKVLFLDRLRGHLGIDAGAAQKQQALDITGIGTVNDISLDHQVVVEKLGLAGAV